MATDKFASLQTGLNSPPTNFVDANLSDTTDLTDGVCRGLHVKGTGGLITVTPLDLADGSSVQVYVAQGGLLSGRFKRVWSAGSGTAATGVMAAY